MKKCPQCNRVYADDWEFCQIDKKPLLVISGEEAQALKGREAPVILKEEKRGACAIILRIMGILAMLAAGFIWLWSGTIGLAMAVYSFQLNKEIGSFVSLGIGAAIGLIVFKTGIGVLRREQWARKALLVFWLIVSVSIIGLILSNISDAFTDISGQFDTWLGEVAVWLTVAVVGILHILFLRSSKVKELFKND
ncbi:hypothetical protein ACFL42_02045 [Candidatus Omnitrophota bacterium]